MLFNSYLFILLFLPAVLAVYFVLIRLGQRAAPKAWLALASLFFYGWWNVKYLPLLLGSVAFNFAAARLLLRTAGGRRKAVLIIGICANAALLGYFKYADFFLANVNQLFGARAALVRVILPLGISFFTFTQIAWLVDAWKGGIKRVSALNYLLFVTYFPHLLAGPIIHHREMMPQFDKIGDRGVDWRNLSVGVYLFAIGLFKKAVVADAFAAFADKGFNAAAALPFSEAWLASLSYTAQLYFDFSGYTDMALGASFMFNLVLPPNFNSPYKAASVQDFWRRWHITLSRFLREYVYIPLGGNRAGEGRVLVNLMIVFVIGGIWHGAGWLFIAWGALHGAAICVERLWERLHIRLPRLIAWFLTFNFVSAAWIFFRAGSYDSAMRILKGMSGMGGFDLKAADFVGLYSALLREYGAAWASVYYLAHMLTNPFLMLAAAFAAVFLAGNSNEMAGPLQPSARRAAFAAFLIFTSLLYMFFADKPSEFIYFNF
ncbi:MAG: MBOAT family protein [Deltaproteobacteria bacterium]|nr:MBOAT family protein [Deltaproteobacteria bacterium]